PVTFRPAGVASGMPQGCATCWPAWARCISCLIHLRCFACSGLIFSIKAERLSGQTQAKQLPTLLTYVLATAPEGWGNILRKEVHPKAASDEDDYPRPQGQREG